MVYIAQPDRPQCADVWNIFYSQTDHSGVVRLCCEYENFTLTAVQLVYGINSVHIHEISVSVLCTIRYRRHMQLRTYSLEVWRENVWLKNVKL